MRIAINVRQDAQPRIIEEDIDIALEQLPETRKREWEIEDQGDGCFTADLDDSLLVDNTFNARLASIIKEDTGAVVTVDVFEDWPPL